MSYGINQYPDENSGQKFGQNPYQNFGGAPPKKPSSSGKILLLSGGCGVIAVLVCCGGGVGLMFAFGSMMSADIELELRDNPQIREHLGEIESLSFNFSKSMVVDGEDVYVYDVQGSSGSGELTVESITDDNGDELILSASLRMSNGKVIEIVVD